MNEKEEMIIQLQLQGFNRAQIANKLGYKRLDSLNRFMRKRGYGYTNEKYVKKQNDENKIIQINSIDDVLLNVSNDIFQEYQRLINTYSVEQLKILGIVLASNIKVNIDSNKQKKEDLIKNIKSFLDSTFKNSPERLIEFFNKEHIPYNELQFKNYKSIRSFLKEDSIFNGFLTNLEINEINDLKKKVSFISPFTESFKRALNDSSNLSDDDK